MKVVFAVSLIKSVILNNCSMPSACVVYENVDIMFIGKMVKNQIWKCNGKLLHLNCHCDIQIQVSTNLDVRLHVAQSLVSKD